MRYIDIGAMFGTLFMLALMVLDFATPAELTVSMIAIAIAPAAIISAVLYWADVPRMDFAVAFSVLWLITGMILEIISPKALSHWMTAVTVAPALIVGVIANIRYWRKWRYEKWWPKKEATGSDQ